MPGIERNFDSGHALNSAYGPTEACAVNLSPYTRMLGHWVFDSEHNGLLFDRTAAEIFGLEDYHQWVSVTDFIQQLNEFDAARFWLNMRQNVLGDMVFERITMISGPYQGQRFIIQGSVLARNENKHALYVTGYVSHESSPYSEFIPREISGDGMYIWYPGSDELVCSASFHAMLGFSEDEFPHTFNDFIERIVHPDDNDVILVQQQIVATPQYGDYFESCQRLKHRDGHYLWTIRRGLVLERDSNGQATQVIGSQTNINLVQSNFDNIKLMMFTDSLTGLHNRNYFQQNALRYEDKSILPVSVIFVDVSGLKVTNDILGHSYGDYLIIKTCEIVAQALRDVSCPNHPDCEGNDNAAAAALADTIQPRTNQDTSADASAAAASASAADASAADNISAAIMSLNTAELASGLEHKGETTSMAARTLSSINKSAEENGEPHCEILRLAGDEFLVLLPHYDAEMTHKAVTRIEELRLKLNQYHEDHTPIAERPVPIFFGLGFASLEQDSKMGLKEIIDLADSNMQADKERHRQQDYAELKHYFEQKKGREVSMRDDRRLNILSEEEREEIRKHRISNIIF